MSHPRRHRASFDRSESSKNFSVSLTSTATAVPSDDKAARTLLQTALRLYRDCDSSSDFGVWYAMLQRCTDADGLTRPTDKTSHSHHTPRRYHLQHELLVTRTNDSGYTALHNAMYHGDLCRILLLLRHACGTERMTRRPTELLYYHQNSSSGYSTTGSSKDNAKESTGKSKLLLREMTSAVDNEGFTAATLLANLQRHELTACRATLKLILQPGIEQGTAGRRSRSNSLFDELSDEQNELGALSRDLQRLQHQQQRVNEENNDEDSTSESNRHQSSQSKGQTTYGCEVFTFGRAHHCALGVVASSRQKTMASDMAKSDQTKPQQHPQRVQAFAQDTVGRTGSAVAVASATYHTLTVTASGGLYSFGLGKGGRLGTGDEKPCATPVRLMGHLSKQIVIGVAAAENHSLCVTAKGHVYAFGSNRFGQLGTSSNGSKVNSDDISLRCIPRRVNDLKQVFCTAVAAGASHSVALSSNGEVYVWGDNSAGQLGIYGRSGSDAAHHKPQRVEALWKTSHGPKIAIALAASDASTLVLTSGSGQKGLANNMVYSWGNGNHVPSKVHFTTGTSDRNVNPIAISCAKYHNVVVTTDGEVYSWGLHANSLGTSGQSGRYRSSSDADKNQGAAQSSNSASLSSPQLVKGMLPENGGGRVVGVSASENHTAVITEDGHLWTWGDTFKQNILGHEGVRWQPVPKRVQGVHRAVAVSAAKEHTVLLIGTSFPPLPTESPDRSGSFVSSLESMAARTIAQHCDLFNILPILITAERTQTTLLLEFCKKFVKLNCDGILNVGQKSAMDCYVNEQLDGCQLESPKEYQHRDDRHNPFITDVVLAGSRGRLSFGRERLCDVNGWLRACNELMQQKLVASIVARSNKSAKSDTAFLLNLNRIDGTSVDASSNVTRSRPRNDSFCPERCDELTTNMDLSSKDLVDGKLLSLEKEIRGVRKRLNQIAKLEVAKHSGSSLTEEQQLKTARKRQLEGDLLKLDQALVIVKEALRKLFLLEAKAELDECEEDENVESGENKVQEMDESNVATLPIQPLRCYICQITCPDEKSHELHMNGRKHRNRMVLVAEDEQKRAAAAMMEEQRRSMLLQSSTPAPKVISTKSVWGKTDTSSVKPKYTLPPPPLPVADTLAVPIARKNAASPCAKKSLLDIMAEESRKASASLKVSPAPNKFFLQLPPGSAPSMKAPPWAQTQTIKTSPVPAAPSQTAAILHNSSLILGDFIHQPSSPKVIASVRPVVGWATPKAKVPSKELSFLNIQEQEMEFKEKEDHAFSPNGSWFIERRERAGSLPLIQREAIKQSEELRLIDEQIAIEKQIQEDLAAKKKLIENQQKSANNRGKARKKCNGPLATGKKSRSTSRSTQPLHVNKTKQQQSSPSQCDIV